MVQIKPTEILRRLRARQLTQAKEKGDWDAYEKLLEKLPDDELNKECQKG